MICAENKMGVCNRCAHTGEVPWNKGKHLSQKTKKLISNSHKGKHHSTETIQKISVAASKENNGFYGKHHSEKTIRKLRRINLGKHHSENTIRKMRERRLGQVTPAIGKNEKQILDEIERRDGIIIDRNFRVIGYKPDGYCHATNTIYEVYEKYHLRPKQMLRDEKRKMEIIAVRHCKFIELRDWE